MYMYLYVFCLSLNHLSLSLSLSLSESSSLMHIYSVHVHTFIVYTCMSFDLIVYMAIAFLPSSLSMPSPMKYSLPYCNMHNQIMYIDC